MPTLHWLNDEEARKNSSRAHCQVERTIWLSTIYPRLKI
jgi:hypothetical protein